VRRLKARANRVNGRPRRPSGPSRCCRLVVNDGSQSAVCRADHRLRRTGRIQPLVGELMGQTERHLADLGYHYEQDQIGAAKSRLNWRGRESPSVATPPVSCRRMPILQCSRSTDPACAAPFAPGEIQRRPLRWQVRAGLGIEGPAPGRAQTRGPRRQRWLGRAHALCRRKDQWGAKTPHKRRPIHPSQCSIQACCQSAKACTNRRFRALSLPSNICESQSQCAATSKPPGRKIRPISAAHHPGSARHSSKLLVNTASTVADSKGSRPLRS